MLQFYLRMIFRGRPAIKMAVTFSCLLFFAVFFMMAMAPRTDSKLKSANFHLQHKMMGTVEHHTTPTTTTTTTTESPPPKVNHQVIKPNIRRKSETLRRSKYHGKKSGWSVLPGGVLVHLGVSHNPHNYTYIVEEKDTCKDFDSNRMKLLIMVVSEASDVSYRKTVRYTWALKELQKALNFRVVFLLGKSGHKTIEQEVYRESKEYGDIVQESFDEKWKNLGKKSVMGLKWSLNNCKNVDYVMKTDQDVLIYIPNLIKTIKWHENNGVGSELLLCHENRVLKILRAKDVGKGRGKYHVPQSIPGNTYPKYCAGLGYVMSSSVLKRLYQAALITPDFFIEDVYITGMCRHKAGIRLTNTKHIRINPTVVATQGICAFNDGRITSSEMSEQELKIVWEGINTKGYFCPQPVDNLPKLVHNRPKPVEQPPNFKDFI